MQPLWDRERRRKICERGVPGNFYLAQPPYIFCLQCIHVLLFLGWFFSLLKKRLGFTHLFSWITDSPWQFCERDPFGMVSLRDPKSKAKSSWPPTRAGDKKVTNWIESPGNLCETKLPHRFCLFGSQWDFPNEILETVVVGWIFKKSHSTLVMYFSIQNCPDIPTKQVPLLMDKILHHPGMVKTVVG